MSALRTLNFIARHPLNRDQPLKALWRFAVWQIASRLGAPAVTVPFVDGTRLLVGRGMRGATGNVYCGLHEFEDMGFVLHALRPGELFVDVGANIGSYSVLAAGAAGAAVVAFEPAPSAFAALLDNLRLNDLLRRVEARNEGVGAQPGRLAFTTDLDTVNHVLADGERRGASVEVPIVTLDAALGSRRPFLLKIDVEGYESAVAEGAAEVLGSPALHAVLMELNGSGAHYGFDESALHARMLALGFAPARYDPISRELRPLEARGGSGNMLYVRDAQALQERVRAAPRHGVRGRLL